MRGLSEERIERERILSDPPNDPEHKEVSKNLSQVQYRYKSISLTCIVQ